MKTNKKSTASKAFDIAGIILIILLIPLLIVELTLVFQSVFSPNDPPSFLGHTPLIVTSGSMVPTFDGNDLIIVEEAEDNSALHEGDIICYRTGDTLITHRIVSVDTEEDGSVMYVTQGDANNTPDRVRVSPSQIIGVYETHFTGLGRFALFMQTTTGMLLCVVLPLVLIFVYIYIVDHRRYKAILKERDTEQVPTAN